MSAAQRKTAEPARVIKHVDGHNNAIPHTSAGHGLALSEAKPNIESARADDLGLRCAYPKQCGLALTHDPNFASAVIDVHEQFGIWRTRSRSCTDKPARCIGADAFG